MTKFKVTLHGKEYNCEREIEGKIVLKQTISVSGFGIEADDKLYSNDSRYTPLSLMEPRAKSIARSIINAKLKKVKSVSLELNKEIEIPEAPNNSILFFRLETETGQDASAYIIDVSWQYADGLIRQFQLNSSINRDTKTKTNIGHILEVSGKADNLIINPFQIASNDKLFIRLKPMGGRSVEPDKIAVLSYQVFYINE